MKETITQKEVKSSHVTEEVVLYKNENILGNQYENWLVIGNSQISKPGGRLARCRCSCGVEADVFINNLVRGLTKGCTDCVGSRLKGSGNGNWKGYDCIPQFVLYRARSGAEKRNIEFSITIEDMANQWRLQHGKCAISGIAIEMPDWQNRKTASLDRIYSNEGYTPENIQWVHKDVNRMKNGYDEDYFIEMCKIIAQNHTEEDKIS